MPVGFPALPTSTHQVQKWPFLIKTKVVAEERQNNGKSGKTAHKDSEQNPESRLEREEANPPLSS